MSVSVMYCPLQSWERDLGKKRRKAKLLHSSSELEVAHLACLVTSTVATKAVLASIYVNLRSNDTVILLHTKVALNDVKGLLVDLTILVALKEFNFVQP